MAKNLNTRCPLQAECERKCTYEGHELDCEYYSVNGVGSSVIADQEAIREERARKRQEEIDAEYYRGNTDRDYIPGEIVRLPIERLHPHPDNPRKELGDLTEIADSIKAKGVFQNLTVVMQEQEDGRLLDDHNYTIIIGHRRRAASELAGLTHLPCVIVEMTPKEQVETMLLENMQREDLTPYEQAQGFQMMLDMGETVDEIVQKTGFSKTTVRKRLEIAKLDATTLKKVSSRQLTLGDFDELAKVEDIGVRNKLLGSMGTANFKNELQSALKDQQTQKRIQEWLAVIKTFATEDASINCGTHQYIISYTCWDLRREVIIPQDAGTVKYYYKVSRNSVEIYKDKDLAKEATDKAEREEQQRKAEERRLRYEDINDRHFDLRRDFVKNLSNSVFKKNAVAVYGYISNTLYVADEGYSNEMDLKMLANLLSIEIDESLLEEDNRITAIPGIRSALEAFPEKALFCMAYCMLDDYTNGYWVRAWVNGKYDYQYDDNFLLDTLYEVLEVLGYEMSDEEKAMQDGTHKLLQSVTNEV